MEKTLTTLRSFSNHMPEMKKYWIFAQLLVFMLALVFKKLKCVMRRYYSIFS
jgi:hypothetical protein